jgi:flagellin-specific chaperone FliS
LLNKKQLLWSWYFIIEMFSREVKSLLEKANNIISELMCTLQEDFGDVFTVVYNQVYEELRIEEIDKEKSKEK